MSCDQWFEALSALMDGEAPGIDAALVEAHLAGCPDCRATRTRLEELRGSVLVTAAPPMDDLSGRIAKASALADRTRVWVAVRVLLAATAGSILVSSVGDLTGRDAGSPGVHAARHLGAFSLAYAVALLVVVARPARARTVLPVAAILALTLLITAAVDIADEQVRLSAEALHLPEVVSVILVWLLAVPAARRWGGSTAAVRGVGPSQLRVVAGRSPRPDAEPDTRAG